MQQSTGLLRPASTPQRGRLSFRIPSSHAKKPFPNGNGFSVTAHRFCCPHAPRISQGKECVQGKPLPGFPCAFNQRAAVGSPDFCSAKISSTKREPPFGWLSFDDCRFLQSKNQSCQRRLLIERAGENRQRCPLHTFLFWRYAGARTTNLWAATKSRLKCASLFAQSGIKNALLRILPEKGRRGA